MKRYGRDIIRFTCGMLLLHIFSVTASAQWGISLLPGKVLRHTEKLRFETPEGTIGVTLNIPLVKKEAKAWHAYYGFPEVSLKMGYQHFNFPEVLGDAFYLMPELRFFPTREIFHIRPIVSLGTGLAYLNRKYDYTDNPDNNAISSSLNNVTAIGLGLQYGFREKHALYAGIRLTHFSNANVKQPNLGINVLAAEVNYSYRFREKTSGTREGSVSGKYYFAELSAGFALSEYIVPGGPKYPNYTAGLMLGVPISAFQSVLFYPFWQKRDVERVFAKNVFDLEEDEESDAGEKLGLAVGLESRFGDLAISIFYGRYVYEWATESGKKWFNLIRLQYIIPLTAQVDIAPGLQFKSTQITAQYIGLLVGLRLKK